MSTFSYYDVQNGEGEESMNTASFASNNADNVTASGSNLEMQAIAGGMLGGQQQRRVRWMVDDHHAALPDIPDYTATETLDSFMEGSTKDSFMEGTTSSRSIEQKTERSSPLFMSMDKSNSSIKSRLSEDEFGFTGFHRLCCAPQEGQDDPLWSDVRDALRDLVRNGKAKDVLVMTQGALDNVPLHLVCFRNPPIDIIERLIKLSPESVWMPDRDTDLAIHYACRNQGTTRVIKLIADSFPESVEFRGENGDTPLGCIIQQCISADEQSLPDPELIRILATPKVLSMADTSDNKPFDLFLMMCANIKHTTPDVEWQAKESLYAFFDCQPGTVSVMSSFKRMPLWLFRHTLTHSYVRRIIDEQVTYPIPTMVLMMDVFANLLLLVSYVSALSQSEGLSGGGVTLTTDSQWETICLELGVGYMILHKLFQLCVVTSWKFAPEWFFDVWNWFDVVVIILIIITTRFVTGMKFFLIPTGGDLPLSWNIEVIQILVTATAGLIWIKLISCLRLIRPSFSNFTCYIVNVIHTLLSYILFTAIVLGAFASMFYVDSLYLSSDAVGADDDGDDRFGFSTLNGSFLKTYVMFVNANISEDDFISHTSTKWLSVFFSLVMFLLLINVLIAVVVVAFGGSNDQSQKNINNNIFWMNRFVLVIESYALKGIFLCGDNNPPRRVGAGIDNELDFEPENGIGAYFESLQRTIEYLWDTSQTLLRRQYFKQWDDQPDESGSDQCVSLLLNITSAMLNLVLKLIILIVIAIWIVLGFATMGLLWPYQLRAWLFCPGLTKYDIHQHKRRAKTSDDSERIISELKRYVDNQSNLMTTERNDMEKRMNERMESMDQTIDKIYEVLVQFNMALIEKKNT